MKTATITKVIDGVAIEIPVGSLDKPSELSEAIFNAMKDPANWKRPTQPFVTSDLSLAQDVAYCLNWYVGGHELIELCPAARRPGGTKLYRVTSKGYYHYVGA